MKRKSFILTLVILFIMTPMFSNGQASQIAEASDSVITSDTNKWSIILEVEQAPEIDGSLDDSIWEEAAILSDFRTAYYNEQASEDVEMKVAFDEDHLYIGLDYTNEDGGESVGNFEVIMSPEADGDDFFHIPVKINDLDIPFRSDWGPNLKTINNAQTETSKDGDNITAEIAIPFDSLGVDEVTMGEEWRLNAFIQHEMGTQPLSSWVPIRTSSYHYKGDPTSPFYANVTDEDRFGSIFMGGLSDDEQQAIESWEPTELSLTYNDFTEMGLTFNKNDMKVTEGNIQLKWRSPFSKWKNLDDIQVEENEETAHVSFSHPEILDNGSYQLQVLINEDNGEPSKSSIISFDRRSVIYAGDALFGPEESEDKTAVSPAPPSDRVSELLELIPENTGFIFAGIPDKPDLHPQNLFDWSPDAPWTLTSKHTDLTYPNDDYPEDKALTVTNLKGETVEYPYYEDDSGKRYFLTAHIWYKQKDYVLRELSKVAKDDPLGAARLLHRLAEVYEGYVPTNDYPWHNEPVEPSSTPPNHWWGGMWYRWAAADLNNFIYLSKAYAMIKDTDAFEVLTDEIGEDVKGKVVEDMFEPSIEYYRTFPVLYHNMEFNNALGLIDLGKALDDSSYVHEAVEWAEGFASETYLFDGFFKETSLSYHNQSTNGINTVIDALAGWTDPEGYLSPRTGTRLDDLDLRKEFPALQKAQEIPNMLVYPDGQHFPTQDTWAYGKSANPQLDAGSFLLPATGIGRMARGTSESGDDAHSGITYDFPSLDIIDQSVEHRIFPDSGTLQFEADNADHHITFAFDVPKTDTYEVNLKPFRADTYGTYEVSLDGDKLTDIKFYGTPTGPKDFEALATLKLTEGEHELTFQNIGKDEQSDNYKMGVIKLALLDEAAQKERDEAAETEEPSGVDPAQLYMTFQPKYGHIHYDPLNLALYANNQEILPDIGYTHTFYRQWTASTLAHNTVVVDGEDMNVSGQAKHGGNIEVYAPVNSQVQVMRASQASAYAQTDEYSREPWMIQFPDAENNEGYVLDLFRVSGGDKHEYTLAGDANHDGVFETDLDLVDYGPYLLPDGVEVREPETELDKGDAEGHYYGYIYVRDVRQTVLEDEKYDLNLVTKDDDGEEKGKMQITGLVDEGENELFLGESPSLRATRIHGSSMDTNTEAVKYTLPKMVLRREGTDLKSQFITAMEPYTNDADPRIDNIEKLDMDQSLEGDLAVKVTYGDRTDIVLSSVDPDQPLVVGDMTLQGKMGMIRLKDGEIEDLYLIGGTLLKKGDVEMTDEGSATGNITKVHRQATGDGQNAFITDTEISTDINGSTIVITHPDGKTHGYEIEDVSTASGQTVIDIGDMDPGFEIDDSNTSALQFYPFTKWNGETTFRIENEVRAFVEREVNVSTLKEVIENLAGDGEIENDRAIHALTIHLKAIAHFEKQEAADKVVKHMNGFKQLLDHQKENEFISEKAYQALKRDTDIVIEQWQS